MPGYAQSFRQDGPTVTNGSSVGWTGTEGMLPQAEPHRVETELLAGTPRRARLTPGTINSRRWLWNLLIGSLCLMTFLGQRDLHSWDALLKSGQTANAIVFGKHTSSDKSGTHYHLDYTFQTSDGANPNGSMSVDSEEYYRAQDNDFATQITYLPGSKGEIWQVGDVTPERRTSREFAWVVGTFCICGLWGAILWGCEVDWRRQLYLLQNGTAVVGKVTDSKITRGSKGETYYSLTYQYSTYPVGIAKKSISVGKAMFDRYTQGDPHLTVLYDPAKPNSARPYILLRAARLDSLSV